MAAREPALEVPSTALDRSEIGLVVALFAAIATVTVAGFALLFAIAGRYDAPAAGPTAGVSFFALGVLCYVLGLRHGVDADHIAAIDNTTRKLLQDQQRPLTVGTWFSLGHSTIVVGLIVALVIAFRSIADAIGAIQSFGTIAGALVSGTFLFLIGLINVVICVDIYRIFRGLRKGEYSEAQLDEQLVHRGFMNRYFGGLFRLVRTPRQVYPIGVLFGLGFDTATEVAAIGVTVALGVSVTAIPVYAVLVLPLLFTCGMVLVDTTDGITMRYAYGWAFLKPIRKIYYNLTVTIISVLVAFVIGGVELASVLARALGLTGGVWDRLGNLDLASLGFLVVGTFVVTWLAAMAVYRYKRFDEIGFGPAPPTETGGVD